MEEGYAEELEDVWVNGSSEADASYFQASWICTAVVGVYYHRGGEGYSHYSGLLGAVRPQVLSVSCSHGNEEETDESEARG